VGFKEIRSVLIDCLRSGSYEHEIREDMQTKNLLFNGTVTPVQVIEMALACKGTDYQTSPLHGKSALATHILKPKGKYSGWYIKFYYIDPSTIFISVHD
jgi:hypothetical protein